MTYETRTLFKLTSLTNFLHDSFDRQSPVKLETVCFAVVPGILGNQLEGRLNNALVSHYYCRTNTDDWETMWLSVTKLLYPEVYCLSDYMK